MSNEILHASASKPRVYPWNNASVPQDIDRVQSLSGGVNQPSELVYELGRLKKVCTDLKILENSTSLTQLEYGEIDFYLALANRVTLPSGGLQLSDFNDAKVDIISLNKDKFAGTPETTLWLPKLSLNSIALNIANADSRVERSFELGGDFFRILRHDNKIYMYKAYTIPSGYSAAPFAQVINDPAPVQGPNGTTPYIERVLRIRGADTVELVEGTDYTWTNGTTTLAILSADSGDIYKVVYTASSFGTAGDYTSLNDVDLCFINADSVRITIESGTGTVVELDRLTGFNMTATLKRISEAVIGRSEKLLKDVESYETKISLSGRVKDATIEEVLMGEAGNDWGIIDPNYFKTDIKIRVYLYSDATKTTFKMGYKVTEASFTDTKEDANANAFWSDAVNLSSDNMLISTVEADIDA